MTEAENSKALLKALDAFDAHQKAHAVTADKVANVCATYHIVKPILDGVVPFLGWIPGVGPRIVTAIKALEAGLDAFCPTS